MISIITIAFNSAETIQETIESVFSQDCTDFEYLVVDGGSTDGTVNIIESFGNRINKFISEPDQGIYDAMNKGIGLAQGELIGFINSDDVYSSKEVLKKVAGVFSDPSIDACYGDLCYVKRDDISSVVRYWRSSEFSPGLFLRGWCPPHPTFFVRRNVYDRFGNFDLQYKIAADMELMYRFMAVYRIRTFYLPEILVKMRMGGTSNQSWTSIWAQNREIWRALKAHGQRPSLISFSVGKLMLRCKQFVSRPA